MKKLFIFIIAVFAANSFAISPFTYKWTIKLTGDTATVSKWKANNDSVLNWASRACDTMNSKAKKTSDSLFSPKIGGAATVDSAFIIKGHIVKSAIDTIVGKVQVDSLKFGASSKYLKTYIDTTWPCTLYSDVNAVANGAARGVIVGSMATIYLPDLSGTIGSSVINRIQNIPAAFRPVRLQYVVTTVLNASQIQLGTFLIQNANYTGNIFGSNPIGSLQAGTGGIPGSVFSYYLK